MNFDNVIYDMSFDMLYRKAHRQILEKGFPSNPRGMPVLELFNCSLILGDPRNRLLKSNVRKHNYTYGCGEFFWYLRGSESLSEIMFYLKRMKDFSDDGVTLNSAYGSRMFGMHPDFSNQWENVVNVLSKDMDSRQAVININYSHDLDKPSKDVPCTLNMQFLIRDNKLNMILRMRSNDSCMGLIYDVFSFTLFQEMMLNMLNTRYDNLLEMGQYVQNSGSLHLYARDFDKIEAVLNEETEIVRPQEPISNFELWLLNDYEQELRTQNKDIPFKGSYSETYKWIASKLNKKLSK